MIPKKFKQRYKKVIPDFDKFLEFSRRRQAVSLRVNTLKVPLKEFLAESGLDLEKVPWADYGFWVSSSVSNTLEYFRGEIYLQDAASMIPPIVLAPEAGERVLDLTAAPGSKTTQMAQMMGNKGVIIANDNSIARIKALRDNINRLGVLNAVIVRQDVRKFFSKEKFLKILLDVPCSLEGSMRKYFINWSENIIRSFAGLQKKMLVRAYDLLEEGGELVYSTCTYAPEENEGVVQHLLNNSDAKLEAVKVKGLKAHPGLREFRDTKFDACLRKCARVYAHDYNTGGFFVAKIVKE